MSSFNKVVLMGNLTRDVEMSYLPSQTPVSEFGLAMNRKWTGTDGQKKEEVCFVDCRSYGKQAETLAQYLHKGDPLLVEGRLTYDQWEDKSGGKRSKLRVTVERFTFLGKSDSATKPASGSMGPSNQQRPQSPPEPQGEVSPF